MRRIVDTSPLILLAKTGRLELLRLGEPVVVVPLAVLGEIEAKGLDDPVPRAVRRATWVTIEPSPPTPGAVTAYRLGPGESAVLSLALGDPDAEVILDDLAARNGATRLGIPHLGTLGLVLLAKRLGAIPLVRPVLDDLRQAGLYLGEGFAQAVLERVGE